MTKIKICKINDVGGNIYGRNNVHYWMCSLILNETVCKINHFMITNIYIKKRKLFFSCLT